MNEELKQKMAKILELMTRGATEGEKAAAQKAFELFASKHNISKEQLDNLDKTKYIFKYKSVLEQWLFVRLNKILLGQLDTERVRIRHWNNAKSVKEITALYTYEEWVTIECSYEYFRRHMNAQWRKISKPLLAKKRKAKTKNAYRLQLQDEFASKYFIASNLVKPEELVQVDMSTLSEAEINAKMAMKDVEGGNYNKQVVGGNLLNETN